MWIRIRIELHYGRPPDSVVPVPSRLWNVDLQFCTRMDPHLFYLLHIESGSGSKGVHFEGKTEKMQGKYSK